MTDWKSHWNQVYTGSITESLGWYEENPEPSVRLIKKCQLNKNSTIFHAGSGASLLIDYLLKEGFNHQIACDISKVAIDTLQQRLGDSGKTLQWIIDDLSDPKNILSLPQVDLWHDRAVLHFFIEEKDRINYFKSIQKMVKKNGYVIIAAFSPEGAKMCSGLPVYQHDAESIASGLGCGFALEESFGYTYTMPSGATRHYIYTLFRRFI